MGFALLWAAGETRTGATEIQLAAPAHLEVRLQSPDGSAVTGREVLVRAEAGELGLGLVSRRGLVLPKIHQRLELQATTDGAGLAVFPSLPVFAATQSAAFDRSVEIVVGLPSAKTPGGERGFTRFSGEPLRLTPGETRTVEYFIRGAARVTGVFVDQWGKHVAEQELWLLRAGERPRSVVTADDGSAAERTSRTDGNGHFDLGDVPVGRWELFTAALDWEESAAPSAAVAPSGLAFEVGAGNASLALRLVAARGLNITGRVLLASGAPAQFCFLKATASKSRLARATYTDADGTFTLGPLLEATYERDIPVSAIAS